MQDWKSADIDERLRSGLQLVEAMTLHPLDIDAEFVAALREGGLGNDAMEAAANVSFHFNLINRLADAFDFPMLSEEQLAAQAKILESAAKPLIAKAPNPTWVLGEDGTCRPTNLDVGRTNMLTTKGLTSTPLRHAVDSFVVGQWGVTRAAGDTVPEGMNSYFKKLSRTAYKIIDEDIEALHKQGLSDEEIFELTLVAASAVALIGVERLFDSLYSER